MTAIIQLIFVLEPLKGTLQIKIFIPSFILFEKRQPINVILPSYREGGSSLEELMVVLLNMCSLLQKISRERNTLRLLIVTRESSKGASAKKIFFSLQT